MLKSSTNQNNDSVNNLAKVLLEAVGPFLTKFAEEVISFSKKAPKNYYELSKHGWYFDFDINPKKIIEFGEALQKGEYEIVNKYLCTYYTENLNEIEGELIKNFPNRTILFKEAFENYRIENFHSSITMLITQIDGICYDITKKLFFKNNPKHRNKNAYIPEFEEALKENSSGLLDIFMSPIIKPTAINEHSSNLQNFPIRLNRHEILHGIDTGYGSKLNNLKIISLLKYLNDLLLNE